MLPSLLIVVSRSSSNVGRQLNSFVFLLPTLQGLERNSTYGWKTRAESRVQKVGNTSRRQTALDTKLLTQVVDNKVGDKLRIADADCANRGDAATRSVYSIKRSLSAEDVWTHYDQPLDSELVGSDANTGSH